MRFAKSVSAKSNTSNISVARLMCRPRSSSAAHPQRSQLKSKFALGLSLLLASGIATSAWAKPGSVQEQQVVLRGPAPIELQVIAESQEIAAASPSGEMLLSLIIGNGTGIYPQINQQGDVIFPAQMWDGDPNSALSSHFYRYRAGEGVQHLLRDQDLLQSVSGNISADVTATANAQYKPTITGDGEALTMCRLSGPGINASNQLGLVRVQQGASSDLLAQNQTALGAIPLHSILSAVEPENRVGEQLIAASLNSSASESAILHQSASGVEQIARSGEVAPATGGAQFGAFPYPLRTVRNVNDNGVAAFGVTLVGEGVTSSNGQALYRYQNGALELVARDGQIADGATPDCAISSSAYSKLNVNGSGKVAFNAGISCTGGHAIFSDRTGSLKFEATAGKLFDGPSGRFRIGLLNEVTTAFGTVGDSINYIKSFLADNGDLYILTSLSNENGSLRSAWAIVRIKLNGTAEVALESSSAHSSLGLGLANFPFPEQVSLARDGSMLVRAQDQATNARVLIRAVPGQAPLAIRDGDIVDGYTVTVGGSNHVSGLALPNGKGFAMVSVRSAEDSPGTVRPAILAIDSLGQASLPVVRGVTSVRFASGDTAVIENYDGPFTYTLKRKVANDAGELTLLAIVQREGMEAEQVIALLPSSSPGANPADFNQDGAVNPADIFAFLAAYFAQEERADINHDGAVTPPDIFAFLAVFFQG